MRLVANLRCWWKAISNRSRVHDQVEEEFRFHLDAYAEDLVRRGMPLADAQRQARLDLGRPGTQNEKYRDAIGLRAWDEVWSDFRYGLRGLMRNPGFSAITILSLALSIGMATAMFSLVHAVLLDVYPYADSDRTVNPIVFDPAHPDGWDWFVLTRAQFKSYRSAPLFEDVLGLANLNVQMLNADDQQDAKITALTKNASGFLRVKPLLGRGLQDSDGDYGEPPPNIVVLGYKFWLKQFGGDASALGRKVRLTTGLPGSTTSQSYTIVGVMPARFTLGGTPDFYMPLSQVTIPEVRLIAFAKLKPGVTAEQASASVDAMVHEFAKQDPPMYPKQFQTRLELLIKGFTDRSKFVRGLPILMLAVAMLLLIGCANCSILLLARGSTRTHEFALRAAIGASPFRLVRQLLVECLTVSLIGSVLGVALSYYLARLPLQLADDLFPSESVIRVDLSVLAFSVALAMTAGVLFGLWPALRFARPQISQTLQQSSRRTASRGGHASLRRLISGQIALTLVLLTVAAGAIAGFRNLVNVHLGYNPENTTFVAGSYTLDNVKTWAERSARSERIRNALVAVPGVISVAESDSVPPSGGNRIPFQIVGSSPVPGETAAFAGVGPNYFSMLQIPLLEGRTWTDAEFKQGLPVAVVNQAFVRQYGRGLTVLDRSIRFPDLDPARLRNAVHSAAFTAPEFQVLGVVADAVNDGLDKPVAPEVYINGNILLFPGVPFLVRTQGDPGQYASALRHALREGGSRFAFVSTFSLQQFVERDESWRRQRLVASLFGIFAVAALALALVGIYSVVAYLVAQRTQEFGIRLALGAPRGHILWLVLRNNLTVILSGTAVGLLLSWIVRQESGRWLEGSLQSPVLMAGTAALFITVAIAACLAPACSAALIQPNRVLHAE
jgi:predicted permease